MSEQTMSATGTKTASTREVAPLVAWLRDLVGATPWERQRPPSLLVVGAEVEPVATACVATGVFGEVTVLEPADGFGRLDEWAEADTCFDMVLAPEGLDGFARPTDVQPGSRMRPGWNTDVRRLAAVVAADGLLAIGAGNPAAATKLTRDFAQDSYPAADIGGRFDESVRPASAYSLRSSLASARIGRADSGADHEPDHASVVLVARYGPASAPTALLSEGVAAASSPGRPPALLADHGWRVADPRHAPGAAAVDRLARAGLLKDLADGWFAVRRGSGAPPATDALGYLRTDRGVLTIGWSGEAWTWRAQAFGDADDPLADAGGDVPIGESLGAALRTAMATGDATRCSALSAWVGRAIAGGAAAASVDDLVIERGDTGSAVLGLPAATRVPIPPARHANDEHEWRLAVIWWRFADEVVRHRLPHPYPDFRGPEQLVRTWYAAAGDAVNPVTDDLLADARAAVDGPGGEPVPAWATDLDEARARIEALESRQGAMDTAATLRDSQLRVREHRVRLLRTRLIAMTKERDKLAKRLADLRGSTTFQVSRAVRTVARSRDPHELAGLARRSVRKLTAGRRSS